MNKEDIKIKDYLIKFKTIFWDFDGVIKDSVLVKGEAYRKTFEEFGTDITNKIMNHHRVNGGISRFKKIPLYLSWAGEKFNKKKINSYIKKFSDNSINLVIDSKQVPGAFEMVRLTSLCSINILITATPEKDINKILNKIFLNNYFNKVYGAEIEKSYAIKEVIASSSNQLDNYIFIGDSETDIKAAIVNKIPFLLKSSQDNFHLARDYKLPFIRDFEAGTKVDFTFTN